MKSARASSNLLPVSPKVRPVMSSRCCGQKPSGPPAAPFLKERIPHLTSSLEIQKWDKLPLKSGVGTRVCSDLFRGGCLAWSISFDSWDGGSIDSIEVTTVTAPLTSPMANLAATRLANIVSEGLEDLALVVFLEGGSATSEPESNASSLFCWLGWLAMCAFYLLFSNSRDHSLQNPKIFSKLFQPRCFF